MPTMTLNLGILVLVLELAIFSQVHIHVQGFDFDFGRSVDYLLLLRPLVTCNIPLSCVLLTPLDDLMIYLFC
jgi:hypothetical protein